MPYTYITTSGKFSVRSRQIEIRNIVIKYDEQDPELLFVIHGTYRRERNRTEIELSDKILRCIDAENDFRRITKDHWNNVQESIRETKLMMEEYIYDHTPR